MSDLDTKKQQLLAMRQQIRDLNVHHYDFYFANSEFGDFYIKDIEDGEICIKRGGKLYKQLLELGISHIDVSEANNVMQLYRYLKDELESLSEVKEEVK